jgi:hypothetical protein
VVQAADFSTLHDLARRGELDGPEVGCVLVERKMRARLMVMSEVASQDSAQVSFAPDEDVVGTLAPDRTDRALRERILPRAVWHRETKSRTKPGPSRRSLVDGELLAQSQIIELR